MSSFLFREGGLVDTVPTMDRTVNTIGIAGTLTTIALIYGQYALAAAALLIGAGLLFYWR